jgi:hypothetical protein
LFVGGDAVPRNLALVRHALGRFLERLDRDASRGVHEGFAANVPRLVSFVVSLLVFGAETHEMPIQPSIMQVILTGPHSTGVVLVC